VQASQFSLLLVFSQKVAFSEVARQKLRQQWRRKVSFSVQKSGLAPHSHTHSQKISYEGRTAHAEKSEVGSIKREFLIVNLVVAQDWIAFCMNTCAEYWETCKNTALYVYMYLSKGENARCREKGYKRKRSHWINKYTYMCVYVEIGRVCSENCIWYADIDVVRALFAPNWIITRGALRIANSKTRTFHKSLYFPLLELSKYEIPRKFGIFLDLKLLESAQIRPTFFSL